MILVIGSNGQLGLKMQNKLKAKHTPYYACDFPEIDITREESIDAVFKQVRPTAVINCAAYTNVDKAESEEGIAYRVNAQGPRYLARLCQQQDIELIHVSTDYVFNGQAILEDGQPRPYVESDPCAPATAYGRTKLAGEQFVQQECARHYILRTAWLYGEGKNFVRTMLKLAQTNPTIRVVSDQIGSPTSTEDLANAILCLLGSGEYGLYHASCEGSCSWYDFARQIFEEANINVDVQPVSSEEYSSPTPRPKWSVLDNTGLKAIGRNVFRPWQDALHNYLEKENAGKDRLL